MTSAQNGSAADLSNADRDTPYLLIDLDQVRGRFNYFQQSMPNTSIHYAMKCNPALDVLRCLNACGCSFEIASIAELSTLTSIGIDPQSVLFSNPVKRVADIEAAARCGVWRFAVDSVEELDKIAEVAPGSAIYVRLSTALHASKVASEGKFGIDPESAIGLFLVAGRLGLEPYGLTFHVGSQMVDPNAWTSPIAGCADVMQALLTHGVRLSMIDVGGGFPVAYDTPVPPFSEFGRVIALAIRRLPYDVHVAAEPGRALVAESGVLVATVIGTAHRFGHKWVHLDVGAFNGMIESLETHNTLKFPVRDSLGSSDREQCHLTGPSCDGQDTILYDVALSQNLAAGDRVYIANAGSYTTSYASSFNGFNIPNTYCSSSSASATLLTAN